MWTRPYLNQYRLEARCPLPRRRKRAGWGRIKMRRRINQKGITGRGWRHRRRHMEPVRYRFGRWRRTLPRAGRPAPAPRTGRVVLT